MAKPAVNRATYCEMYSDGPGVEFEVTYKRESYLHEGSIIGYVNIKHLDYVTFPITKVEWLIDCLQRVLAHHNEAKS